MWGNEWEASRYMPQSNDGTHKSVAPSHFSFSSLRIVQRLSHLIALRILALLLSKSVLVTVRHTNIRHTTATSRNSRLYGSALSYCLSLKRCFFLYKVYSLANTAIPSQQPLRRYPIPSSSFAKATDNGATLRPLASLPPPSTCHLP